MSQLRVKTHEVRFPVAKTLYGLFFEDINRSGDGGICPERLRNRTFEDSLLPPGTTAADEDHRAFHSKDGWKGEFNHGEGLSGWIEGNHTPPTPIPAWYAENAAMRIDGQDTLHPNRRAALAVDFGENGRIWNIGYAGVPAQAGSAMVLCLFAKAGAPAELDVRLTDADGGRTYARAGFRVSANGYTRYDAVLVPDADDGKARFEIRAPRACSVRFGFVSLMPADTYNGHGLRKDLVEKLAALRPGFMRYPGGCIVEGFNKESLLRFSNLVGPVWERPSNWNLWAYNTTNGFGYHEWLQLCEDLDMKKMWVCNCGMTCQARNPDYLDEAEQEKLLQEAIDAIEYATAPADSQWGRLRAAAGHPAPFGLDFVEIGNENHGPEYNRRYARFFDTLKKRYPDILFIANTHVERDGLSADIVDEHFYNTPEFFAENTRQYDAYDRTGPRIFVGEYAVVTGNPGPGTLKAAIGEAMFLLGMEKNQDVVTMGAYAPLFENVHFDNWYPNLIAFDNRTSYGIPSYHMLKMLGSNRGADVVRTEVETPRNYARFAGLFGLQSHGEGMRFKDVRVDGQPAPVSNILLGHVREDAGEYVTEARPLPARISASPNAAELASRAWVTFGTEKKVESTLELRVWFDGGLTLNALCRQHLHKNWVEPFTAANIRRCDWTIRDGVSRVMFPRFMGEHRLAEDVELRLETGWHDFRIETREDRFDVYADGRHIQTAWLDSYPGIECAADTDGDRILVKIANMTSAADEVEISLDRDVETGYTAEVLAGDPAAENALDRPEAVAPVLERRTGAGRRFRHTVPAMSLSILTLKAAP